MYRTDRCLPSTIIFAMSTNNSAGVDDTLSCLLVKKSTFSMEET